MKEVVMRGDFLLKDCKNCKYLLTKHVLGILIRVLSALNLALQLRDSSLLALEFLVIRLLLLDESGDGLGCDPELRRGRHLGRGFGRWILFFFFNYARVRPGEGETSCVFSQRVFEEKGRNVLG